MIHRVSGFLSYHNCIYLIFYIFVDVVDYGLHCLRMVQKNRLLSYGDFIIVQRDPIAYPNLLFFPDIKKIHLCHAGIIRHLWSLFLVLC